MKDDYRQVSLVRLCRLLVTTRQAWHQHYWREEVQSVEAQLIVDEVINNENWV